MASPEPAPISRRSIPGGGPSVSVLGFVVETVGPASARADRAVIERLRQARTAGVTLFDTAGSREPERARALVASAFPDSDPLLVVVVRDISAAEPPARISRADPPAGATPSPARGPANLTTILERAPPRPENPPHRDGDLPGAPGPLTPPVAIRLDPSIDSLPRATGPSLYSGPFSLLERRLLQPLELAAETRPVGLIARDPFAGGRLDGSRFAAGWLERGPSGGPPSLRSLAGEFGPVLRFGFLTAGHARTLAQAALQYVASHSWVVSVLAPLPPADRLDELLAAFDRPPLTPEEISRVDREPSSLGRDPTGPSLK